MALDHIDHFSIRTLKLEETREFYENVMGMVMKNEWKWKTCVLNMKVRFHNPRY